MSYRKNHIKDKLHRAKPKKSIFKMLWFWILLLILIVIISGFYFLFFYPGLQIKNILISGNVKINTQNLNDATYNYIEKELASFFNIKITSKSILLVNTKEVNKKILEKFPEIEKLKINKKLPQTMTLAIVERKPIGAYCDQISNNCFMIDPTGTIFELLTTIPADTTIVRQNMATSQAFLGQKVISQNIITAIYKIKENLKNSFQIDLKEALVTSPIRLDVNTSNNWKAYFDLSPKADIDAQIKKLNLLLGGEIATDNIKNLKYIDLRPKDRAIVCDNSTCGL
ncbi:MAG: FtsQ-type POTRA domain-containing protein [Candidatus Staskawiczbacteria bacterium]|jgi:cell division septal protein FtsQ